ncbi:MAG: hypothetical protein KIT81_01875, partial [Alphaproteobacteria bacterium]|nr:hypothetical protein [Alphaproteobacteria bacterium]
MFGREATRDTAGPATGGAASAPVADFGEHLAQEVARAIPDSLVATASRGELARITSDLVAHECAQRSVRLTLLEQRNLVTILLNGRIGSAGRAAGQSPEAGAATTAGAGTAAGVTAQQAHARLQVSEMPRAERGAGGNRSQVDAARELLHPIIVERLDAGALAKLPRAEIERQMSELVTEL